MLLQDELYKTLLEDKLYNSHILNGKCSIEKSIQCNKIEIQYQKLEAHIMLLFS